MAKRYTREELEQLGVWDWDKNGFPPYWSVLRLYVFRRDKYRCNRCHRIFRDEKLLDAHHVIWRQHGGSDNPKNLVTVCEPCHNKIHDADLPAIEKTPDVPPEASGENGNGNFPIMEVGGRTYRLSVGKELEYAGAIRGVPRFSKPSTLEHMRMWKSGTRVSISNRMAIFYGTHIHAGKWHKPWMPLIVGYNNESLCGESAQGPKGHFSIDSAAVCGKCFELAEELGLLNLPETRRTT